MSKKKGKKKGGKKGKGGDDEINDADMVNMLNAQVEALKIRLVHEQGRADGAKAAENELRVKMVDLDKAFKQEEITRKQIVSDMTHQYKAMQDELMKENNDLKKISREQEDTIKRKETELVELARDREMDVLRKDEEIRDLKRKIEDMSAEFARMLRETLDKMQERIELAQWDNDSGDPQMMKRLKDIAGFSN
jgi:hypothetical protein